MLLHSSGLWVYLKLYALKKKKKKKNHQKHTQLPACSERGLTLYGRLQVQIGHLFHPLRPGRPLLSGIKRYVHQRHSQERRTITG